jgi:hypothetical protein
MAPLFEKALAAALSSESTTSTVTVSRASAAQVELCDVSDEGLSAYWAAYLPVIRVIET